MLIIVDKKTQKVVGCHKEYKGLISEKEAKKKYDFVKISEENYQKYLDTKCLNIFDVNGIVNETIYKEEYQKPIDLANKEKLSNLLRKSDIKIARYNRQVKLGKQTKYTEEEILAIEEEREEWATELENLEKKYGG